MLHKGVVAYRSQLITSGRVWGAEAMTYSYFLPPQAGRAVTYAEVYQIDARKVRSLAEQLDHRTAARIRFFCLRVSFCAFMLFRLRRHKAQQAGVHYDPHKEADDSCPPLGLGALVADQETWDAKEAKRRAALLDGAADELEATSIVDSDTMRRGSGRGSGGSGGGGGDDDGGGSGDDGDARGGGRASGRSGGSARESADTRLQGEIASLRNEVSQLRDELRGQVETMTAHVLSAIHASKVQVEPHPHPACTETRLPVVLRSPNARGHAVPPVEAYRL